MKLAVVGGGSTYTPELVDGFARLRDTLPVTELVLVDPAQDRLELVGGLARRIFARQGHPGRDRHHVRPRRRCVDGADAVLLQLRVGGQAAREQDETWPLECGCVGQETTGAGGLAKALRTVPVVLDIAERVRRSEPGRLDHRLHQPRRDRDARAAAGGSQGGRAVQRGHRIPAASSPACSDVRPEEVHLDHVGLNHLTWERAVRLGGPGGEDVLPGCWTGTATPSPPICACRVPSSTGSASSPPTTSATSTRTTRSYGACGPSRPARPRWPRWNASCWGCTPIRRWTRSPRCWRSGAARTTPRRRWTWPRRCWAAGRADVQVVNTLNDGTWPFLADDAVIEVPARVTSTVPSRSRPPPPDRSSRV